MEISVAELQTILNRIIGKREPRRGFGVRCEKQTQQTVKTQGG